MEGYYCPDRTSAVAKALELMPEGSSIAWGGSMSLHESGLMEAVCHGPYKIIDRESAKTPEEQRQLYGKIACCDYFLMSTNAITMAGELVNIDGRGNRVAFLCYGPQNVIILAGMNKVVTDVDAGLKRVRNTAQHRPPAQKNALCGHRTLWRLLLPGLHLQPVRCHQALRHSGTHQGDPCGRRVRLLIYGRKPSKINQS